MKADLERHLEDKFDFSIFGQLSRTREAVRRRRGKLLYFPTDVPVPFDKRILSELVGGEDIRVMGMPTTTHEFQERVFTGIEQLVDKNGDIAVVFFCPRFLADTYAELPGSSFVEFERVNLQDPTQVIRNAFRRTTNQDLEPDTVGELAVFALRLFSAAATGAELNPVHVRTASSDSLNEFTIAFDDLDQVSTPVHDFFLTELGVSDIDLYDRLDENAQQNIYTSLIAEKYGLGFTEQEAKHRPAAAVERLDADALQLFRTLLIKWLVQGRLFDATLEELSHREMDRAFVETVQRSYQQLVSTEDRINVQAPGTAAEELNEDFGILLKDVDSEEFRDLLTVARDQLSQDSQQITAYSPDRAIDVVERVDRFLHRLAEIALIQHPRFVNEALPSDRWTPVFQRFLHSALDNDREDLLAYRFIPALNQARKEELRERAAEDHAATIRDLPTDLSTLPEFLDHWCEFLATSYRGEEPSPLLRQEFIDKYDAFCDVLASQYTDIVESENQLHISDLLQPTEDDTVRIVVIIDSFGYTDFRLLQEFDFLDTPPDDIDLVTSNFPSYTPSAIASMFTGLPAEKTGIFGWQPRQDTAIHNLRHSGYEPEDFDVGESTSTNSFHLIQRPGLNTTGITAFARAVSDIRVSSGSRIQGDVLEDVESALIEELEQTLEERHRVMTDGELPEAAREAQKSDIVLYIEDFDQYLHQALTLLEFENYYRALGNFLGSLLPHIWETADQYVDHDVEVVVTSDHGKLTRYEKDLILEERPEYAFNQGMLTDTVDLDHAYLANFRKADFTNRSSRVYLSVATDDTNPPVEKVRDLLSDGTDVTDEAIFDILEEVEYTSSGAKYAFGWTDDDVDQAVTRLERLSGIDTYCPQGEGIFDVPNIGILSRYDITNQGGRAHGYHGGTSISEMTALRLIYQNDSSGV
jgi:hypothetical protein